MGIGKHRWGHLHRVWGFWAMVLGLGPRVQISGFRLSGLGMIRFTLNPKPLNVQMLSSLGVKAQMFRVVLQEPGKKCVIHYYNQGLKGILSNPDP